MLLVRDCTFYFHHVTPVPGSTVDDRVCIGSERLSISKGWVLVESGDIRVISLLDLHLGVHCGLQSATLSPLLSIACDV
jgi:hypothetical protein